MKLRKGTLVKTSEGKIGEVIEVEGFVVKNLQGTIITDVYDDWDTCESYRLSINKEFTVCKIPNVVKLGKNAYQIYSTNLRELSVIYFSFYDCMGNLVIMKQSQNSGLLLKKFLEKANIRYYMSDDYNKLQETIKR